MIRMNYKEKNPLKGDIMFDNTSKTKVIVTFTTY